MLVHGADAMGGSTDPDGERGFGRIHLESAMPFEGEDLWALYVEDDDGSTTGVGTIEAFAVEDRGFVVTEADAAAAVEAGNGNGPGGIRVTLVWMDPPATAASSTQLVHDLDLFLEGPEGDLWTTSGKCDGDDESSCSLDGSNNVERIVVPASDITAGTWTARVSAANDLVEGGPQSYALVVSLPISSGPSPSVAPAVDPTEAPEAEIEVSPSVAPVFATEAPAGYLLTPSIAPVDDATRRPVRSWSPSMAPVLAPSVAPLSPSVEVQLPVQGRPEETRAPVADGGGGGGGGTFQPVASNSGSASGGGGSGSSSGSGSGSSGVGGGRGSGSGSSSSRRVVADDDGRGGGGGNDDDEEEIGDDADRQEDGDDDSREDGGTPSPVRG
ncbi:unnamed protein product, partial [Laminaria digitata]